MPTYLAPSSVQLNSAILAPVVSIYSNDGWRWTPGIRDGPERRNHRCRCRAEAYNVLMTAQSPWSPLRHRLFRGLWIATIVSNIGTWMHEVGAGWLMTSLSSSPSMVALVEAADSLPGMLLALPAGAIADIVDRRRLLIGAQVYFLIVIGALAMLTALDMVTPWLLLAF